MAGAAQGRGRGNGLAAPTYAPVLDCDPRLADAILARLACRGLAAYAAPSPGQVGGYLEVRLPRRPVDRLYVDAGRCAEALDLLREELPAGTDAILLGPPPRCLPPPAELPETAPQRADQGEAPADVDAAWSMIVAGFGRTAVDPHEPPPAALAGPGPYLASLPAPFAEEEPHYEPPEPAPIPAPTGPTRWGLAAVTLGVVLLFAPLVPGLALSGTYQITGILCLLAGGASLVWHMRDDREDPDDDGAVL
jgi:hypothetical protein